MKMVAMRDRLKIKAWLVEHGISQTEIARRAKVTTGVVYQVMKGERHSMKVLQVLLGVGVPARLLEPLPAELKRAA